MVERLRDWEISTFTSPVTACRAVWLNRFTFTESQASAQSCCFTPVRSSELGTSHHTTLHHTTPYSHHHTPHHHTDITQYHNISTTTLHWVTDRQWVSGKSELWNVWDDSWEREERCFVDSQSWDHWDPDTEKLLVRWLALLYSLLVWRFKEFWWFVTNTLK